MLDQSLEQLFHLTVYRLNTVRLCVCNYPRSARQQQREVARDKVIRKKLAAQGLTEPHAKRRRTLSGSTDGYGISQLFLPDNAPRGGDVSSTSEQDDVKPNANVRSCCTGTS